MTKKEEILVVLKDIESEMNMLRLIIMTKEQRLATLKGEIADWRTIFEKKNIQYNALLEDLRNEKGE